jgi:hypothetical protein
MNPNALIVLEDIINQGIEEVALPYVSGNSIRIKHLVVRNSKAGWLVYNSKTHSQVARLFCKSSAVALAKSLSEGKNKKTTITELDKIIEKNYNDCMFYKNTLEKSTDAVKRAITLDRFEISVSHTKRAKKSLDRFIFH